MHEVRKLQKLPTVLPCPPGLALGMFLSSLSGCALVPADLLQQLQKEVGRCWPRSLSQVSQTAPPVLPKKDVSPRPVEATPCARGFSFKADGS